MAHKNPNELGHHSIPFSTGSFDSPATPGIEYNIMWENWRLPEALVGGTQQMRKEGRRYLPQNPRESDKAYSSRLERTFLANVYKRTIDSLAAQPFIKPVQVDNIPPELRYLEEDADSTGRSLTEVAHEMLWNQLHYGLGHVFVDHPEVDGEITLAEQRRLKIRPYFNVISPYYLIFHDGNRVGGVDVINEIRFVEYTVERVEGTFAEDYVQRVRSITPDAFTTYLTSHPQVQEPYDEESSAANPLGKVPLATAYGNKAGFLTAKPVLEDLAWLNLRHWQSTSEQNNILHVARVPILVATGFEEGDLEGMEIGGDKAIVTSNSDAAVGYAEHSGDAIGSGENDLENLEKQMKIMGSDILMTKSADRQTATARKIDSSESLSMIQTLLRSLEGTIENAYRLAGEWIGVDASGVTVSIGNDMSLNAEANSTEDLLNLHERGLIDSEIVLGELKRRGTLAQKSDIRNEVAEDTQEYDINQN